MEEKHTPGPWEAGQHPANAAMNIVRPIMFGNRMGKLPECEGGHSFIRSEADAKLIAAAPDLLAALQEVEFGSTDDEGWDRCPTCGCNRREGHASECKLAAAIAKATA